MSDDTGELRKSLIPTMPEALAKSRARGEQEWDTRQLQEEFDVIGFAAPFVGVIRKSDGVRGALMFTHSPRVYFGFQASEDQS